jgi:hypothetical protein
MQAPPVAPISPDAPSPTWKNGQPYSEADKKWRGLQQSAMKNAKTRDWGLYTNDRLDLATERRKEGKTKQALDGFLDVIYLDINGPENSGMGWNPSSAMIAPAVVEWAWKAAQECEIDQNGVEALFLKLAVKRHESLRLPVSPAEALPELRGALESLFASIQAKECEKEAKRLAREAEKAAKRVEREAAKALEKERNKAERLAKRAAPKVTT